MPSLRVRPADAIVLATAITLRGVHLAFIHGMAAFTTLVGDGRAYWDWAGRIRDGAWVGSQVFYQAPLYPYFLAVLRLLPGGSLLCVRVVQGLIGAASCVLVARAACRLLGARAGLVAGLLMAAWPALLFADGIIQKSTLDVFFTSLALLLLVRAVDAPTAWAWLALGATLGGLALTRENAIVLVAVALAAALRPGAPASMARRAGHGAALAAGLALVLAPVALRNMAVGGELHVTTAQLGPNLYIGNNADADGTYRPLRFARGSPETEREDATRLAETAVGRALGPREVSRYWMHRSLAWIGAHPRDWIRLMARKTLLTWNATEIGDSEDQYTCAAASPVLRVLGSVVHFGLLGPLALAGAVLTWDRRARLWPLHLAILGYTASVALFYVFARYRLPLVPLLAPLAAAALVDGVRCLRERRAGRLAVATVIATAAAMACNWPLVSRDVMQANSRYSLGIALAHDGKPDDAVEWLEAAVSLDPLSAEAHAGLGSVLRTLGRLDEAANHLREAIRLQPDYSRAHFTLALVEAGRGDLPSAEAHLRDAAWLDPEDADAESNLGTVLIAERRADRVEEAATHFARAAAIDPSSASARFGLAVALQRGGHAAESVSAYRDALRLDPQNLGGLGITAGIDYRHQRLPLVEADLRYRHNLSIF